eukprot:SAG31_NODE_4657_length_3064_cov_1.947049_3_plen_477_part_00
MGKELMPPKTRFEELYPRGYKTQVESFNLVHLNHENFTLNNQAAKFGNFLNVNDIKAKAQSMLLRCLELLTSGNPGSCGCRGDNVTQLLSIYRAEIYAALPAPVVSNGPNVLAVSTNLASDVFDIGIFDRFGISNKTVGLFNYGRLSAVNVNHVKKECLDSAFETKKHYLARPFESDGYRYTMYIDPQTSPDAAIDIIAFTEAHGWIDSMTRHVRISFSNYNPSTNTFTSSIVKCDLQIGGLVHCRTGVEVLRVGHYHGLQIRGVFRLALEIMILLYSVYMACEELREVRRYQKDYDGTVVGVEMQEEVQEYEYRVRMASGTVLSFLESKLRAKATQMEISEALSDTEFRRKGEDIFAAYPKVDHTTRWVESGWGGAEQKMALEEEAAFRSWFAESVTPRTFRAEVKIFPQDSKRDPATRKLRGAKSDRKKVLFLITSGQIEAKSPATSSGSKIEWTAGPGDIFGNTTAIHTFFGR